MKIKSNNTSSTGIGAVYTASTGALVDSFQSVGYVAKATKAISIAGVAKASVAMLESIGETLETLGYDVEKMSPVEVMDAWNEFQSQIL